MPIITLLSDWGLTDHYVASVKGAILSRLPDAVIVDISHTISLLDIRHAALVMRDTWRNFPPGTIHIIGVASIESDRHSHVIVKSEGHYFIGADTGLISIILDKEPEKIIAISVMQDSGYFTSPVRDRFVKVAALLANGISMDELGDPLQFLNTTNLMQPHFDGKTIYGKVTHIDNYENVFLNVSVRFVNECFGTKYIKVACKQLVYPLVSAYDDVSDGEQCALFASNGFLQLAMNRGKLASICGIKVDTEALIALGSKE